MREKAEEQKSFLKKVNLVVKACLPCIFCLKSNRCSCLQGRHTHMHTLTLTHTHTLFYRTKGKSATLTSKSNTYMVSSPATSSLSVNDFSRVSTCLSLRQPSIYASITSALPPFLSSLLNPYLLRLSLSPFSSRSSSLSSGIRLLLCCNSPHPSYILCSLYPPPPFLVLHLHWLLRQ